MPITALGTPTPTPAPAGTSSFPTRQPGQSLGAFLSQPEMLRFLSTVGASLLQPRQNTGTKFTLGQSLAGAVPQGMAALDAERQRQFENQQTAERTAAEKTRAKAQETSAAATGGEAAGEAKTADILQTTESRKVADDVSQRNVAATEDRTESLGDLDAARARLLNEQADDVDVAAEDRATRTAAATVSADASRLSAVANFRQAKAAEATIPEEKARLTAQAEALEAGAKADLALAELRQRTDATGVGANEHLINTLAVHLQQLAAKNGKVLDDSAAFAQAFKMANTTNTTSREGFIAEFVNNFGDADTETANTAREVAENIADTIGLTSVSGQLSPTAPVNNPAATQPQVNPQVQQAFINDPDYAAALQKFGSGIRLGNVVVTKRGLEYEVLDNSGQRVSTWGPRGQ